MTTLPPMGWRATAPTRWRTELDDASMEQKTADELDEYLNDLCNRRTNA